MVNSSIIGTERENLSTFVDVNKIGKYNNYFTVDVLMGGFLLDLGDRGV